MPGKMVTSTECENCKTQCQKGKRYLERLKFKGSGNGVYCSIAK